MLKNNKQRGTGLRLVHGHEAFEACFETTSRPGLEGMMLYRWAACLPVCLSVCCVSVCWC